MKDKEIYFKNACKKYNPSLAAVKKTENIKSHACIFYRLYSFN